MKKTEELEHAGIAAGLHMMQPTTSRADEIIACLEGEIAKRDARIVELESDLAGTQSRVLSLQDQWRKLDAELAEIKAQEPVAYIPVDRETGDEWLPVLKKGSGNICDYKPLYAAPVSEAKAQGVVMPERATEDNTCPCAVSGGLYFATADDLAAALGRVKCLHDLSVELIAEDVFEAADHVEVVRAMVVPKCKCSMSISVLGDGCRYCQPQEYIDRIHDQMEADRAMVVPDGYALVLIEPTIEMAESMYFDGEDYTNSKDFDDFKIAWSRLLAVAASGDSK